MNKEETEMRTFDFYYGRAQNELNAWVTEKNSQGFVIKQVVPHGNNSLAVFMTRTIYNSEAA